MKRGASLAVAIGMLLTGVAVSAKAEVTPPICAPGQNSTPSVPCTQPTPPPGGGGPLPPLGNGVSPTPPLGGGTPAGPIGSGFKSAYPADRSVSAFTKANPDLSGSSYFGVAFDSSARIQMLPYVSVEAQSATGGNREQHLCQDLADSSCAPSAKWQSAFVNSGIGNCANTLSNAACVESFSLITSDGKEIKASPISKFPQDFKEFPAWSGGSGSGYTAGVAPWIWRADGDGPGSEHDYYLTGTIYSVGNGQGGSWQVKPRSFYFEAIPVFRETSSLIKAAAKTETEDFITKLKRVDNLNQESDCLANDTGVCLHRREFPADVRLKITLKMPRNVSGWLNGRLLKPEASVTQIDNSWDRVSIEANPTQNIMAGTYVKKSDVSSADWKWLDEFTNKPSTAAFAGRNFVRGESSFYVGESGEVGALNWYKAWAKWFGSKAFSVKSSWTVQTTQSESTGGCVKPEQGLQGIVSTNAAVYSSGAPQADNKNSTLTYQVASPLKSSDGSTNNVGVYSLSMSTSLLKCLYNVNSIPTQAQIAITNDDGKQTVQTSSIKTSGSWVNFGAYNFDYSDLSLLTVKLDGTQNLPAPSPSATLSPSKSSGAATSPKQLTITCIKGKTTKVVTGAKPTCPAGFKVKK
jgi:hypothetical protein